MTDGRVFEGSAVEIVEQMKALSFGLDHLSLAEYIDWTVEQAREHLGVLLSVDGSSDDERAASFVAAMRQSNLAS